MSEQLIKKSIERDADGLIKGIEYIFDENGLINWRAMIKPEFLVPNKQTFERRNTPVPETIDGLKDNELLILLGGIKQLAQIRGYTKVDHQVTCPSKDYVIDVCHITFLPNYETEGKEITFSAIGDASLTNSNGFGKNYLGPTAENRGFVRCVRNFLKINIVSQEEVNGGSGFDNSVENVTNNMLKKTMDEYGVTFELIKKRLEEEGYKDSSGKAAIQFTSIDDIGRAKQFELIERIKKKATKQ